MSVAERKAAARKAREYADKFEFVDFIGAPLSPLVEKVIRDGLRNAYCAGYMAARGVERRRKKK